MTSQPSVSPLLADLPSKGYFKNATDKFVLEATRDISSPHTSDTSPADRQIIATDKTNILIRSLLLRRQRHVGGDDGKADSFEDSKIQDKTSKKRMLDVGHQIISPKKRLHVLDSGGIEEECSGAESEAFNDEGTCESAASASCSRSLSAAAANRAPPRKWGSAGSSTS